MFRVSVYGGVESQRIQSPRHVDTSSGVDRCFGPGRCKGNSWAELHAHFVKHMGCPRHLRMVARGEPNMGWLRPQPPTPGQIAPGEVTAEVNKCPPST